jgi:hypothetical protein
MTAAQGPHSTSSTSSAARLPAPDRPILDGFIPHLDVSEKQQEPREFEHRRRSRRRNA